jgi:hypothetical protein
MDEYLRELDAELSREEAWPEAIAIELLSVRGHLLRSQIAPVFRHYAEYHGLLHEQLAGPLVDWLASAPPDGVRDYIIGAANEAIQILDETSWDIAGGGLKHSAYPYLIFPLVVWAYSDKSTDECDRVFLRGLKFIYQETPRGPIGNPVRPMAVIEPLLTQVTKQRIGAVLQKGTEFPDPAVRAFATLALATQVTR